MWALELDADMLLICCTWTIKVWSRQSNGVLGTCFHDRQQTRHFAHVVNSPFTLSLHNICTTYSVVC